MSQGTGQDYISIKEIFIVFNSYFNEVKKSFLIVLIALFIIIPYFVYKNYTQINNYKAELSFMVNEDDSGGLGGALGGILGGFGFGGSSKGTNLDKILTLLRSRRITDDLFLKKAEVNGTTDILANHMINHMDTIGLWFPKKWYQKWQKESPYKNFRLSKSDTIIENRQLSTVLNILHARLVGNDSSNGMLNTEYGELDFIMRIYLITQEEELSKVLIEELFSSLDVYYVKKTIEKHKYTYDIIEFKVDSIYTELKSSEYQLAKFKDSFSSSWRNEDNLTEVRLNREIQKLQLMLGEAIKNKELADFTLKNKTPFLQILDAPRIPLPNKRRSLFKALISGFTLSLFLSIGFIAARKFIMDVLK